VDDPARTTTWTGADVVAGPARETTRPIRRVLIANRGEIARRIVRTCRELGIATVAVHSDADVDAPHVREADAAVRLGPAPATESYLDVDRVVAAALDAGADAVHPGYGFLSEHAGFAEAVEAAGLTFVGPSPATIRLMGDKAAAKRHLADAGVPVVPGADTSELDEDGVVDAAGDVGFPLLVKAVAGGGGKGMRVVHEPAALREALAAARREARAAFGDDRVILERLVERPRHVEVQVMGDAHGEVIHLLERECSVQRRHQKVVEEAPSPAVDEALRTRLGDAAVAAARSVGYLGAGTVEFLLDGTTLDEEEPTFFFLEMNTRLQVEHPVTELVTGLDLVALQLRVATGAPLGIAQDEVRADGHAIEVRWYAEDPATQLPQVGSLARLALPTGPGLRADVGVEPGGVVSRYYDPMLGKLIAHGHDREAAIDRLLGLVRGTVAHGVVTNLDLLDAILDHPVHRRGELTTSFLEEHLPGWRPAPAAVPALAVAAAVVLDAEAGAPDASWPTGLGPVRHGGLGGPIVLLHDQDRVHHVRVAAAADGAARPDLLVTVEDAPPVRLRLGPSDADGRRTATVDGVAQPVTVTTTVLDDLRTVWVHHGGRSVALRHEPTTRHLAERALAGDAAFTSPMPGSLIAAPVEVGTHVAAGTTLLVVEAMKMEHAITAPVAGTLAAVHVAVGDAVDAGTPLLTFEPDEEA
jgi:acetyl-CoA/propionyl-CoA carboxylase, biotin carboxylase, biotin carboxyl carrier protein